MTHNNLQLQNIEMSLHGKTLLAVDQKIAGGQVFTVMGPSGSGKSSLLAFIAGFLPDVFTASGRVLLNNLDLTALPPEQRGIGLLFQDPLLFPHLSVGENLRFGLPAHEQNKDTIVAQQLAEFGMDNFADRDPATLSGGQKSRVALLRLLLSQPKAVLLDEPFSQLDSELRQEVREMVFATLRAEGLPVILVTHDRADAEAAGGQILELK